MSDTTSATPKRPDIDALRGVSLTDDGVLCLDGPYLRQLVTWVDHLEQPTWPMTLDDTQEIVEHLLADGSRSGLMLADRLNKAMGASARRRAEVRAW